MLGSVDNFVKGIPTQYNQEVCSNLNFNFCKFTNSHYSFYFHFLLFKNTLPVVSCLHFNLYASFLVFASIFSQLYFLLFLYTFFSLFFLEICIFVFSLFLFLSLFFTSLFSLWFYFFPLCCYIFNCFCFILFFFFFLYVLFWLLLILLDLSL